MSWLNLVVGTPFPFLRMEGTWRSPSTGLTLYQVTIHTPLEVTCDLLKVLLTYHEV